MSKTEVDKQEKSGYRVKKKGFKKEIVNVAKCHGH